MMHPNTITAVTAITLFAGTFGSADALADSQPIIQRSGFSETQIPQVKGRVPVRKNGNLEKGPGSKTAAKPNPNANAQNGAATCGPDNAQSEFCRKK
ncbi:MULTISPECIES: hypothetical protein [unclassified Rhizobium]|jgi:hypothetical protein|uniref:hypothetical protein n=1 Tax=unclassified Rhizobium TaxID=2613769 RepID=UPI0006463C16|nr:MULTISPECIES: hypothetical protein [unclassified Rhizobium]MBN8891310.1 hypothetical protein [Rhodospirillales bacterium]MBN8952404.1 hypothetical protein [Rhizobium tropici]OJY78890.1 MAG: hypothetical protein BGP09_23555 [Rhizobium sp. 60-20]RKD67601.1 hypothetical protein BJ928_1052 [Rhizobium sp. WW_1]